MSDRTSRGRPVDERSEEIRRRRMKYEISALQNTVDKYEIDILEAEANIERMKDAIVATQERIQEKREELEEASREGDLSDG